VWEVSALEGTVTGSYTVVDIGECGDQGFIDFLGQTTTESISVSR